MRARAGSGALRQARVVWKVQVELRRLREPEARAESAFAWPSTRSCADRSARSGRRSARAASFELDEVVEAADAVAPRTPANRAMHERAQRVQWLRQLGDQRRQRRVANLAEGLPLHGAQDRGAGREHRARDDRGFARAPGGHACEQCPQARAPAARRVRQRAICAAPVRSRRAAMRTRTSGASARRSVRRRAPSSPSGAATATDRCVRRAREPRAPARDRRPAHGRAGRSRRSRRASPCASRSTCR